MIILHRPLAPVAVTDAKYQAGVHFPEFLVFNDHFTFISEALGPGERELAGPAFYLPCGTGFPGKPGIMPVSQHAYPLVILHALLNGQVFAIRVDPFGHISLLLGYHTEGFRVILECDIPYDLITEYYLHILP